MIWISQSHNTVYLPGEKERAGISSDVQTFRGPVREIEIDRGSKRRTGHSKYRKSPVVSHFVV